MSGENRAPAAPVRGETAASHWQPNLRFARHTLGPLALLVACPPFVLLLRDTHVHRDGSLLAQWAYMQQNGVFATLWEIWRPNILGSPTAWAIIGVHSATQLALMRLLPGKRWEGPVTPKGNVPVYTANGVAAFVTTIALWFLCTGPLGLFPASILYDNLGPLYGALNLFALIFCLGLYLKGRFAPSSSDSGHTGNFLFDYYWGTELYPRILGWDLKMFTNCRFGMMAWPLLLLSYAGAQVERTGTLSDGMIVALTVQLFYLAKFYWWEDGYLRSIDIMHDRAGFYICWGCLVWVPSVYTQSTIFLVDHPVSYEPALTAVFCLLGIACVTINYLADADRQRVRATQGNTTVWGKPPETLVASYVTASGERKQNLLLVSGWWGIARHFHYLPEILGAFFWTLPVGFGRLLPWFYVIFLTILLLDRARRDHARCAAKYGAVWDEYRKRVRWEVLPGVF
jgi:7-dehydrocholesterol reductase